MSNHSETRQIARIIPARATSDGAGVKIRRSLGQNYNERLDPFLMLDEFSSEDANDYIGGFPPHPHRGFETVTYMLDGHMRHEDHLGNRGDLRPGSVQWMTAGRGIIHSEMPQQESGRMRGFQLWVNLPAREKMKPASYRDIDPAQIPNVSLDNGGQVKVIAGHLMVGEKATDGPITGLSTDPLYLDVYLPPGENFEQPIDPSYNAFIYTYEGEAQIGDISVPPHSVCVMGSGARIEVSTGLEGARFLLLAGRPIGEPIVQHGPFVMNTQAEIDQAIHDYQNGTLTQN